MAEAYTEKGKKRKFKYGYVEGPCQYKQNDVVLRLGFEER